MATADDIIEQLQLEPLPEEGGYFRRIFRHPDAVKGQALSSAIYYLMTAESFSAMHRIASTETFHFHAGDPAEMLQLHPDGSAKNIIIGNQLSTGQQPFVVVPKAVWQGTRIAPGGSHGYALLSVTVVPEFLWDAFELANRQELITQFPAYADSIRNFTCE